MGFFRGEFLVQGVFGVLLEALGIFGSWLLAPFDHHLKSRVPPWEGGTEFKTWTLIPSTTRFRMSIGSGWVDGRCLVIKSEMMEGFRNRKILEFQVCALFYEIQTCQVCFSIQTTFYKLLKLSFSHMLGDYIGDSTGTDFYSCWIPVFRGSTTLSGNATKIIQCTWYKKRCRWNE